MAVVSVAATPAAAAKAATVAQAVARGVSVPVAEVIQVVVLTGEAAHAANQLNKIKRRITDVTA